MRRSIWKGTGLLLLVAGVWSCKGGADVEAPSLQFLLLDPAPRTGEVCGTEEPGVFFLSGGDSLHYQISFLDNEALSQYKIDIHENFDCHGHARTTEDWSVLDIRDLPAEQEQVVSGSLVVPADVTAGSYHFQVQVVDAAGNDDPLSNIYAIVVTNRRDTVAPVLLVSEPAAGPFSVLKGSELVFKGQATDNYSLGEGGNGKFLLTYTRLASGNTFEAVRTRLDDSTGDRTSFDLRFQVPNTLVAGAYRFVLSVYDGVNNESERVSWEVEVE